LADDFGSLKDDTIMIRNEIFPNCGITPKKVDGWLDDLAKENITRNDGIVTITNYRKHQSKKYMSVQNRRSGC
jgi:hypothetical protein